MPGLAHRPAPSKARHDPPAVETRLSGDHIGFDAWLLPPAEPEWVERLIHGVSIAAGPLALAAALAGLFHLVA